MATPNDNNIRVIVEFGGFIDSTFKGALANVEKSLRDITRINAEMSMATGRALPALSQQVAVFDMMAQGGDKVAASLRETMRHQKLFYQLYSGNSKQNIAELLRNRTAVKETSRVLKKELQNMVTFEKGMHGVMTSVANDSATRFRFMSNLFAQRMNRAADSLIRLGKQWQWVGRQLMVGVTAPFVGASLVAGKEAVELSKKLTELAKFYIQGSESAEQVAKTIQTRVRPELEALSIELGISIDEIVGMASAWAATGQRLETGLLEVTRLTAQVTALSQGELTAADSMEFIRTVMATFGRTAKDVVYDVEALSLIAARTSLNMTDMAFALPRASSAAQKFGLSVTQTAAALAGMREKGVPAIQAAQGLKSILISLAAPTEKAAKTFKEITGEDLEKLLFTAEGAGKGVEGLRAVADAVNGLSDAQESIVGKSLVNKHQIDRFFKLLQAVKNEQSDFNVALRESEDAVKNHAAFMKQLQLVTESLGKSWDRIKAKFEISAAKIGEVLVPIIERMTNRIIGLIEVINNLPVGTKKAIAGFAGMVATLGPLIYVLGQFKLVLGSLSKGPAMMLIKMFGIKGMETPERLAELAASNQHANILAGIPFTKAHAGLREGRDAATYQLLRQAALVGEVPEELLDQAALASGLGVLTGGRKKGTRGIVSPERNKKGHFQSLGHKIIRTKITSITAATEEQMAKAGSKIGQTFWQKIAGAGKAFPKSVMSFIAGGATSKWFGNFEKLMVAKGGDMGTTTGVLVKFTSIIPKLLVLLPLLIAASGQFKDIWVGARPELQMAAVTIKESFADMGRTIVSAVTGGASEGETFQDMWIRVGKMIGKVVGWIAKAIAGTVKLLAVILTPIITLAKVVGETFFALFTNIRKVFKAGTEGVHPLFVILGKLISLAVLAKIVWGTLLTKIIGPGLAGLAALFIRLASVVRLATTNMLLFGTAMEMISKNPWMAVLKLILVVASAVGLFGAKVSQATTEAANSMEKTTTQINNMVKAVKNGNKEIDGIKFGDAIWKQVTNIYQIFGAAFDSTTELWENFLNGLGNNAAFKDLLNQFRQLPMDLQQEALKRFKVDVEGYKLRVQASKNMVAALKAEREAVKNSWDPNDRTPEGREKGAEARRRVKELDKLIEREERNVETGIKRIKAYEMAYNQLYNAASKKPGPDTLIETLNAQLDSLTTKAQKAKTELSDALGEQLDQATDRVVEAAMDHFDDMADARIEAIDKQIEAIRDQEKEEEKAQKAREDRQRRQEILQRAAINAAIAHRERMKAILEGRFDDARLIQLRLLQDNMDASKDLKDLDKDIKDRQEDEKREQKIDELEAQKDHIRKQLDAQKELFQNMMEELTEFGARNMKEWKSQYKDIEALAAQFGVSIPKTFAQKFGHTIAQELEDARADAETSAARLGKETGTSFGKGLSQSAGIKGIDNLMKLIHTFNVALSQARMHGSQEDVQNIIDVYIPRIRTAFKAIGIEPSPSLGDYTTDSSTNNNTPSEERFHSGGFVRANKPAAEVPAILQQGEFVMNRKAVSKIGLHTLQQANKYHHGGLVRSAFEGIGTLPLQMLGYGANMAVNSLGKPLKKSLGKIAKKSMNALLKGAGVIPGAGGNIVIGTNWTAPVDAPVAFWNDFGASRGGGTRTHKGNDIFPVINGGMPPSSATNRIVRAPFSGTLTTGDHGIAGKHFYVRGRKGYAFGAHLARITKRYGNVRQGTAIGYVGDTGNAASTAAHLHFEWHPRNGPAVNPYDTLKSLYGARNKAGAAYGSIKKLDTGGIVKFDTPAMIHAGETVIPKNVTQALSNAASGGSGVNIKFTVNGDFYGDDNSYKKLYTTLERAGRKINRERGNAPVKIGMRSSDGR